MIPVKQIWLAVNPLDMRCGADKALARVVQDFGYAKPHHAYVFTNKRANRIKVLVHDGATPVDNNQVERQVRPISLGKKNWLFAGSLCCGERTTAAGMTLIQSAKLNGHEPYAYMKDVLTKLPTQPHSQICSLNTFL